MATKKTTVKAAPKAKTTTTPKAPKAAKAAKADTGPRHPKGRADKAGGKAELAKTISTALAHGDESASDVEARLKTASNAQLLRLQKVVSTVKAKWGDRSKLIAAIGTAEKKSKDKSYLDKLATFSLPQLVDLAVQHERRAR
ncbi:MAG TPA: hypothetical protein VGM39_20670 [Kofleriaceae bacterium]|jgi:hypothetical protein